MLGLRDGVVVAGDGVPDSPVWCGEPIPHGTVTLPAWFVIAAALAGGVVVAPEAVPELFCPVAVGHCVGSCGVSSSPGFSGGRLLAFCGGEIVLGAGAGGKASGVVDPVAASS